MVDLCYVISHGFSARMILHSDLVPELTKRGLKMAVVTPNAEEPAMRKMAADLGVELHPVVFQGHLLTSVALERIQRYVFEDVSSNAALWAKHLRDIHSPKSHGWQRSLAHLMMGVNRVARWHEAVPRTLQRGRELALHSDSVERQLRKMGPRLVVATYPMNPVEGAYLRQADRMGLTGVSHLLSWDNITCKGRFAVLPPYHISWGPIMSAELEEHYGVDRRHIFECGVPHFDAHLRPRDPARLAAVLEALGLDAERPYLFFGMSSPVFAPREIELVEWLAGEVARGRFGRDVQLVVRPHPQNVTGDMADLSWLARLKALHHGPVAVDIPQLEPSRLKWNMKREDLPRLAELVGGCAICLNSGSTLSIDAIIQDRPVIMTPFDVGTALPWWGSAQRLREYPHLAKLISLGGLQVARDQASLAKAIDGYLTNPALDADGRERTRRQECGPCDGRAALRVADALDALVRSTNRDAAA